jgi:hypothetical protein
MKNIILVLLLSLLPKIAFAGDTTASISSGYGWNFKEQNTSANLGVSLGIKVFPGIGWWQWSGVGSTAKDELWVSHVQGIDWSFNKFTTTLQYKVSKDPNFMLDSKTPFDQEASLKIKIKLW